MQPHQPLTLRRNFSWTFLGNACYAACQWGMVLILAKLGTPEKVGQFTLGLAITAPILMLANLSLRHVQITDAKQQYRFNDYLGLRLICASLALLAIVGIAITTGYSWETSLVIVVIGLAKVFESISDIFYGLIQKYERMDRVAISLMLRGWLSLVAMGIGVYLTGSVLGGAIGLAIAWATVLVSYDIHSSKLILTAQFIQQDAGSHQQQVSTLQPQWCFKKLSKLVWLTLPLGFVLMLISLNTNIPRYFIQEYLGERELGIFAAIAYLMVAGGMVVGALAESASPRLAKYYAMGDETAFWRLLLKLVGIGALLGGIGVLVTHIAGREILSLLYRSDYAEQADLLIWLMVAAGIGYIATFLGYGMTAARYFRIQLPLFVSVTGISAIACVWLIPTHGLYGAAIAQIVAAIVQATLSLGVLLHGLHKLNSLKRKSNTTKSLICQQQEEH